MTTQNRQKQNDKKTKTTLSLEQVKAQCELFTYIRSYTYKKHKSEFYYIEPFIYTRCTIIVYHNKCSICTMDILYNLLRHNKTALNKFQHRKVYEKKNRNLWITASVKYLERNRSSLLAVVMSLFLKDAGELWENFLFLLIFFKFLNATYFIFLLKRSKGFYHTQQIP